MQPYKQSISDNVIYREFNDDIDPIELVWHRDEKDREVEVLQGEGWFFQFDNELPLELRQGVKITIPKFTYHRVIKGTGPLKIKIQE